MNLEAKIKQASGPKKSYSQVVTTGDASTKPTVDPLSTVRVFPKRVPGEVRNVSSQATKQIVQSLNLGNVKVGVNSVKPIHGGGVSILCRSPDEAKCLGQAISDCNQQLEVNSPKMKNPTFSMWLQGVEHDKADLEEDIIARNDFPDKDPNSIKIVHTSQTGNGNTIAILETSPKNYRMIKDDGNKLYIGFARVNLRERSPLTQCNNCQRFWHTAKKCRFMIDNIKSTRCVRCGENHLGPCQASLSCSNCKDYNAHATKRGAKLHDSSHAANDENCPIRAQALREARSYINYA
ncbi:hypothetical protein BLOT_008164 [Blomia tropicalis]|nr:hypothetical protein BLOT_008164 [Blomia tropicalis]